MESAHKSDLAPFFKDLSQSEKNSEIKPPLHSVFELSAGEKKSQMDLDLKYLFLCSSIGRFSMKSALKVGS